MDLETIQTLYGYNRWANERVLDAASKLTAEQFSRDIENSFRSVRDTLVHILSAEWIWLERWKGSSPTGWPAAAELSDIDAVKKRWEKVESDRAEYLRSLTPASLKSVISYKNIKGEPFAAPLWQLMLHVVNHSTYHRGQITTLLRQVGGQPVSTDLSRYLTQK
jgi:uncharacterized damage-inducible protein DinB